MEMHDKRQIKPIYVLFGAVVLLLLFGALFLLLRNDTAEDKRFRFPVSEKWQQIGIIGDRFFFREDLKLFCLNETGKKQYDFVLESSDAQILYLEDIIILYPQRSLFIYDPANGKLKEKRDAKSITKIAEQDGELLLFEGDSIIREKKDGERKTYIATGDITAFRFRNQDYALLAKGANRNVETEGEISFDPQIRLLEKGEERSLVAYRIDGKEGSLSSGFQRFDDAFFLDTGIVIEGDLDLFFVKDNTILHTIPRAGITDIAEGNDRIYILSDTTLSGYDAAGVLVEQFTPGFSGALYVLDDELYMIGENNAVKLQNGKLVVLSNDPILGVEGNSRHLLLIGKQGITEITGK